MVKFIKVIGQMISKMGTDNIFINNSLKKEFQKINKNMKANLKMGKQMVMVK